MVQYYLKIAYIIVWTARCNILEHSTWNANISETIEYYATLTLVWILHIFIYQYAVTLPLASSTARTRCGILSINRFSTTDPMSHHDILCIRSLRMRLMVSGDPLSCHVSEYWRWSSHLRWDHRCSIGFKSGELPGRSLHCRKFVFSASFVFQPLSCNYRGMWSSIVLLKYNVL